MKMLSLDPLASLGADEFIAWMVLTLFICFLLYMYSLAWAVLVKKLFGRFPIKCEVPSLEASSKEKAVDRLLLHNK